MRFVAEWCVLRLATAAQRDSGSSTEVKFPAILIVQVEVTFHFDTTIRFDDDLRWHRLVSRVRIAG